MGNETARDLIVTMPDYFRAERARRVNAVIQFQISGEGGGDWYMTVKDGTCTVTEGISDAADATLKMKDTDYVDLANGKLGGMKAFLSGKIKTSGDFSLLQRMQNWFPKR